MPSSVQPRPEFQAFWGTTRLKGPIAALTPREQAVAFLISGMPDDLRAAVRAAFLGSLPWSFSSTPPATPSPQRQRPDETALESKLKLIRSRIEVELALTRRVLTAPAHAMSRMTRNVSLAEFQTMLEGIG